MPTAAPSTQKEMTFYICNVEDAQTWPVYFPADSDVPYISLRDWAVLMPYIVHTYVREGDVCTFELTYSMAGKTGALTREDGYFAEFDCVNDTILFEDYDAFLRGDNTKVLIDVLGADDPTPGQDAQFFRRTAGSYERYGDSVLLDLGSYGIELLTDGTDCYAPCRRSATLCSLITMSTPFTTGKPSSLPYMAPSAPRTNSPSSARSSIPSSGASGAGRWRTIPMPSSASRSTAFTA